MGAGILGLEVDGFAILDDGFVRLAGIVQHTAQVHVSAGDVIAVLLAHFFFRRLQFQCGAIVLNGAVKVAPGVKHVGQIILRAGHFRIEAHCLLIFGDRTVEIAIVLQRQPQIVVGIGIVGRRAMAVLNSAMASA